MLADAHIPDRDYTPIENPEDDPYGKGCYGYDTLRLSFNDNQAIRAANKAVEEYKKRKAERPEGRNSTRRTTCRSPVLLLPKTHRSFFLRRRRHNASRSLVH